jgi:sulfite reductase (NADPH) flavoprotein alpha-component
MREGSELDLTVGRLLYQTRDSQVSAAGLRLGTASHFLGERSPSTGEEAGRVSLRLVRPPRFNLPADPSTPIVMFAGGTGIGPFRGFIQERSEQPGAGESWLFFSTRTRGEFFYQAELERLAAAGRLHVQTAFSGEAIQARFVPQEGYFVPGAAGGRFVFESGEKRRIGEEMLREENAQMLWDLLRSRQAGGQGAFVYVCGRTGFASSVMAALKEVLRRFSPGSDAEKEAQVHEILYRMAGEGRYMQDIFTTYTAPHPEIRPAYDASEIVVHNDEEAGYWLAINGRVYDVTEFAHLHPGGFQVIRGYTGMDATRAYQKVLHHANPEVDSQLGMYEIGAVRRLDFGMEWGVAIGPRGLQVVTLADAYRTWVRFLYTLAEMENALHNDFTLQARALTREESPTAWSPLKLQFMLEVHDRFLLNYVEGSMGQPLEDLWAVTAGLCAPDEDARWMRRTIEQAQGSPQAGTLKGLSRALSKEVQAAAARGASDAELDDGLARRALALLEVEDKRFLREMKMALRAGVQVFERYERETLRQGGPQLLEITRSIPHLLEAYQARVLSSMLELYVERDA